VIPVDIHPRNGVTGSENVHADSSRVRVILQAIIR